MRPTLFLLTLLLASLAAHAQQTTTTVRDRLWLFTVHAGANNVEYQSKHHICDFASGGSRMTPAEGVFYLGVPWLEAQFIANLADTAGASRAGEPHDAVFASQHLITIHALSGGKKTLRPHYPSKITDATTGEVIAEKSGEFSVDMPFGQTRVFRTEALAESR